MSKYVCKTCHFIYDESQGDSKNGIPPGTPLKALAGSLCATCGMAQLQRYWRPASPYQGLEAEAYGYFCGKWWPDLFLTEVQSTLNKGQPLLEVGAGTGRVTRVLLEKGYPVTALEKSSAMLQQLRKQAWTKTEALTITAGDFHCLPIQQQYQAVLLTDGLIQELASESSLAQILAKLAAILAEGGAAWLELLLPSQAALNFQRSKQVTESQVITLSVTGTIDYEEAELVYTSLWERYDNGWSSARYRVQRQLQLISITELEEQLPELLSLVKVVPLPRVFCHKQPAELPLYWSDGGYPWPDSAAGMQKIAVYLKKRSAKNEQ